MDFDESTAGMALAGKASGLGQAGWTSGQGRASLGSGLGQAALGWHGPDCLSWAPDPSQLGNSSPRAILAKVSWLACYVKC